MAERIELTTVTIPAGTAVATPLVTVADFNDGGVERIEVTVPPGPSGLVGFRIAHSGQTIIPYEVNDWVITDDEKISWPVEGFPTGNKWSIIAYNTDIYLHKLYFRWHLNELVTQVSPLLQPVAIE